jgi:hypothetical protein
MWVVSVPRPVAQFAVSQLAAVDYNVANRVTEGVADVVAWSYAHDLPWVARVAVQSLQLFDDAGSLLITAVLWLVAHAP